MRKHFIRSFVALLMIFTLLLGTTAFAESATVVGNAVNLRSGRNSRPEMQFSTR